LLIIAGFGYLAGSLTAFLFPDYLSAVSRVTNIVVSGELSIILWLLIMGAKNETSRVIPA
jgi:hypothetical protein